MNNSVWQWIKVMSISAFCAMLLSFGAGPAMAINHCIDCDPGDNDPPPPPPAPSCSYDQPASIAVPATGWGPSLLVKRATEKTTYTGFCSTACPNASYSWQGPGYCECYNDTIPELRVAGVGTTEMQRTRYAIWSEPPKANTRTLLVALAGQNGVSSGGVLGGGPGNVTGQPNNWLAACNDWTCGWQPFGGASFVGRLLGTSALNITASNTFAVSFPDHQYDWSSPYRAQIRQGLFNWLKSKGDPSTSLKQIIIAGHSRGGCLALGLIKEFRADPAFNAVKILGAAVDGTCMDGEQGTLQYGGDIDNPLPDVPNWWPTQWYAWPSTFSTANNQNVCIQNTVGGEPQALPASVHSFFLTNPAWHNTWMNIPHVTAGQCIGNYQYKECGSGGNYNVTADVLDRALRFVVNNRVP